MEDNILIEHLLPSAMIIKNFVQGEPDCNYEKYMLEFVNESEFFRAKSNGELYQAPYGEENGECDCISKKYQLDFKLVASKTALQARSILSAGKATLAKGVTITMEPKQRVEPSRRLVFMLHYGITILKCCVSYEKRSQRNKA